MFRILPLWGADCVSLGRAVGHVGQYTTFGRQLPLGALQLMGALKESGGRRGH